MGIHDYGRAAALCTLTLWGSACGGGGGHTSDAGGGPASLTADLLSVVSHTPSQNSVQIPIDASIGIEFDGIIATECLKHNDTWLRIVGSDLDVPVTFSATGGGRSISMTPAVALLEETDYMVQLAALTCDRDGRLLEENYTFSFRSFDATAPSVLGTSIADGATNVAILSSFNIEFDEALDPTSIAMTAVRLLDIYGTRLTVDAALSGNTLTVNPLANLAGNRSYLLEVKGGDAGIADRSGNRLESSLVLNFRTAGDSTAPVVVSHWPTLSGLQSPLLQPSFAFSESMDPFSVENAALNFIDQFANIIGYSIEASADQKTLRIIPFDTLVAGRSYTISLAAGPGAVTDLSGNTLASPSVMVVNIGTDFFAPRLLSSHPREAESKISPNARPLLRFDEALDPSTVNSERITLMNIEGEVATQVTLQNGGQDILVEPASDLSADQDYQLVIRSGHGGLRDLAGNPLPKSLTVNFKTSVDATTPSLQIWPRHGELQTPPGAHISILSDTALDPTTLSVDTVRIENSLGNPVTGTLSMLRSNRLIRFIPDNQWSRTESYVITVRGGPDGLRKDSGNWLTEDLISTFEATSTQDLLGPTVSITTNALADQRKEARTLPRSGFEINITAFDPFGFSLDMASCEVELTGPGEAPDAETIFAMAIIDGNSLRWRVPTNLALQDGSYTVQARVRDLSGNEGLSNPLSFQVKGAANKDLPFERTHVVWVRFDLDRNNNGTADFEDDLLRLGLISDGDPVETNARMLAVMRNGILTQCNKLYKRKTNGGRIGSESVAIRFSQVQPIGVAHMQIACGGLDPEGDPNRVYGDSSSGILGRAFYDYLNANINDINIGKNPGVGVFPGELFLFEARIHQQVFPSFITSFAQRFLALAPTMDGTSAGNHAADIVVIDEGFQFDSATTVQKARFNAIFLAADDWAVAIGTILAHEVGHSVGLVATGINARALHGDSTLHNNFSSSVDVMAAAVGYDSLINLDFRMRDLNIAYLQQRVLLK